MYSSIRLWLFTVLLLVSPLYLRAQDQNYPVTITPFFIAPESLEWSDFYGDRLVRLSVVLKDNAQLSGNVKLFFRFRLERVGIVIENTADFVPSKGIMVNFGTPLMLSGKDLSENFLASNLESSGIDESLFRQGGQLPDGMWTLKVRAYEYDAARGYRALSNESSATLMVYLGQPPLLTSPLNGSEWDTDRPNNLLFQWTPRANSTVGGLGGIAYQFELWELGSSENENDVASGKQPILSEVVNSPLFLYDASKAPLVQGKRYAWRVKVIDANRSRKFENEGYSEVWTFRYGVSCPIPSGLQVSKIGSGVLHLSWNGLSGVSSYQVRWQKSGEQVYSYQTTNFNFLDLNGASDSNVDFEVRSLCKTGEYSDWSEVLSFVRPQGMAVSSNKNPVNELSTVNSTSSTSTDPLEQVVSSATVSDGDLAGFQRQYEQAPNVREQRCGGVVISQTSSCEIPQASSYGGAVPFNSSVNSTIYINGYEIVITKVVNDQEGEGLLYFPYLGKRIPVEWKGVSIREGEQSAYGCIVSGTVQAQGSNSSVLGDDLKRQYLALYNNLNNPGSFTGTFGQAIELMKQLATKLSSGEPITSEDLRNFKNACKAVNKGTDQWISQLNDKVRANPTEETTELIASISSTKLKIVEMLNCGNANNSTTVPSKGPAWDDRFLTIDCHYSQAKLGGKELIEKAELSKSMFTPPPTNKLTCLVNLSELKTQLGTAINTFVCPDGGLVTLADADEINFYTYDKSWYPNGSVLGIKKGNKNYIARLLKSGSGLSFTGFVDYDSWKANGYPPNTSFHATAPTLNQDLQVWAIEQSEDQHVRNIGLGTYSTPYYKQGEINTEGRNRLNYVLDQTASSCNFINNAKDATPKDGYSSQAGLEDLKTKLNKYTGLGDVVFKITDKNGNISHVTKDKIYKPTEAFLVPSNATVFEITEDADGKVDVNGKFKADPTCATCAGEAQKALTAALANMKAKHGGKIDPKKNVIEGSDFGINAGLAYQNMSLGEALTALAKGYNSLVENAKVPVEVWEPTKAFSVKDNWGVITGGIDGAITEGTDKAQLVGTVLTVISNPKKTATDVAKFAKGAVSSWDNAKNLIKTLGQGIVGYDASDFEEGKHAVYKGRGIGKVGGTLAVQAMSGGGLLGIIQNAPDQLDNLATRIANLLQKFKNKLKSLNWTDAEIDDLANRVGQNQKFLDGFDKLGTKTDDFCSEIKSNEVFKNRAIDNPDYIRAFNEYDPNKIYQINNQIPINSGPPNPKLTLSGQTIYFDNNGFPDFTPYVQSVNDKKQFYKIDMQGSYEGGDFAVADAKAGISKKYRDDNNLTWHHHQDGQTMMLVPREINSGIRHTGGNAVVNHNKNNSNNILYFPSPIIN